MACGLNLDPVGLESSPQMIALYLLSSWLLLYRSFRFPWIFQVLMWLQPLGVQGSLKIAKSPRINSAFLVFAKAEADFLNEGSESCCSHCEREDKN